MFLWLDKTSLVVALLKKEQVLRSNPIWRHIRLKWEHDSGSSGSTTPAQVGARLRLKWEHDY